MSDTEKARHYIEALDAVRCHGRWQEIPELVRKIGKHAKQRQCLCITAQIERQVATLEPQWPYKSSGYVAPPNLVQAMISMEAAIEKERTFPEDLFQARICKAWLHAILKEYDQVLSSLPALAVSQAIERFTNIVSPTARWTHVCIVKGAYLRGIANEDLGNTKEAVHFYESIFPYLAKTRSTVGNTSESDIWTERLLARHVSLASRHVISNSKDPHSILQSKTFRPTELLGSLRLWSEYKLERQSGSLFDRTSVWKAYYDVLSILLQHQLTRPFFPSKSIQYTELNNAQASFEAILMTNTHFPQANQSNIEIDRWVDQVMSNWRALLAPRWRAGDLGQGGHIALGKTVLEILYRSATRTFHSTTILRHLFTVHAALGEFNLAAKALDTYLEIVKRGVARVEKSGETEIGLDDDTTALCTAAEGVRMLCYYGNRFEAERAREIADVLQTWARRVRPASNRQSETSNKIEVGADDNPNDLADEEIKPKPIVSSRALAVAYNAIGISQRTWARLTYEETSRPDLITEAISSFRAALHPESGNQEDIFVLYSLAYTFAEQRDIDSAITTIKEAISLGSDEAATTNGQSGNKSDTIHRTPGILLKCWHLLALLLSARQNFEKAMASCEAAEELYGGKTALFGDSMDTDHFASLPMSEKKGLLELKITQLALCEVADGPEEAVNLSSELLGLYAKLFRSVEKEVPVILEPSRGLHKSNTNSPQRSIRESILGYSRDRRSKLAIGSTGNESARSLEPPNDVASTPAIAVTSDDTVLPQDTNHHHHFLGRHESNKLKKRHSRKSLQGGSQRRSRTNSPLRPATADSGQRYLPRRGRLSADGPPNSLSPYSFQDHAANEVGVAISHDMPPSPPTPGPDHSNPVHDHPSTTQNMNRKNFIKPPVDPQPSFASFSTDSTSSSSLGLPEPKYTTQLESRHALSLLTKIWCQISGLYRRAGLASDARGAIREAQNHVKTIESAIAKQEGSSSETFSSPGYGGLSSLCKLWADVHAESGALHASLGETAKASEDFETALQWDSNHSGAIVGLSANLLDLYESGVAKVKLDVESDSSKITGTQKAVYFSQGVPTLAPIPSIPVSSAKHPKDEFPHQVPRRPNLMALSARDRAFKLLSGLTKSGSGWDNSEAWFALAKAYELSGQVEKSKEALWWVVELEEGKGVRPWEVADVV